ncbi:uncharacterized protein STEHIDRAFT_159362 [Stereum hirsutum FP-91666 SS1]|uniref:uncharacterized protein n=1 Tax=Stereum hirsutum (strain FP-91666) TaxID=721885 RepID=UPI0004449627|nr:uncharacterized protein STEHIDRAFT_159362 [Stereum hirsutum FP-91666 SS1]EIM83738.1 hypothetical protein STEHIDRAFT_159362 [Stereum hirsutum FP-91666 SS1]
MVLVAAGCSFLVNIICTTLLAFRLWKLSRSVLPHPAHHSVIPIMWIMVDSAGLYTVTLATTVASVITNINALAIMIEVTIPIISIAFYGVLIRVGMGQVADYNTSDASETVGVLSTVLYLQPVTSKDQHPSDPESSRQHSE